jgi:gluconate 2-dehydrogenase gamma chain
MLIESMANMDRRGLMARVLLLVGASVTASACQTMDAIAPVAAGTPGRLTVAQMATLTAAADAIIPETDTPGAVAAGVPERFEGLLVNWASPQTRTSLETVLARIDGLSGDGRSFAALTPEDRHRLLSAHDAAAMQPSDRTETVFISARAVPTDAAYGRFKDLIVSLYFMSQAALTQELVYQHVPGRWEPSTPVTATTRPWADVSNF